MEMERITKTRKQRIEEQRKQKRKRIVYSAAALTVTTVLLTAGNNVKACDCVDEYVVKAGDTLYSLAKRYGVTVEQLKEKNHLSSNLIHVGQTLHVPFLNERKELPFVGERKHIIQKGDTLWELSKRYGVSVETLQQVNQLKSSTLIVGRTLIIPEKNVNATHYTVQPGDTLYSLAKRFRVTIEDLKKENGLQHDIVYINQKLQIPSQHTFRQQATLVGAVDTTSLEFLIEGMPVVVEVSYGATQSYKSLSGQKGWLTYTISGESNRPALISFERES